jgi:hypothetical protein
MIQDTIKLKFLLNLVLQFKEHPVVSIDMYYSHAIVKVEDKNIDAYCSIRKNTSRRFDTL